MPNSYDLDMGLLKSRSNRRAITPDEERTIRMCEFWTGAIVGHYSGGYDDRGIALSEELWREACDYADRVTEQRFPGWLSRVGRC